MNFIGICCEGYFHTSENSKYAHLYRYIKIYEDNVEVIILYDKEHPFLINKIAIQLDNSLYNGLRMYSVWDLEFKAGSIEECGVISCDFAYQITKFLKDTLKYFTDTERIIIK